MEAWSGGNFDLHNDYGKLADWLYRELRERHCSLSGEGVRVNIYNTNTDINTGVALISTMNTNRKLIKKI